MDDITERLQEACIFCGGDVDPWAADPGLWPLRFTAPDGTGIVRTHHVGCVTGKLRRLASAEAVVEAARASLDMFAVGRVGAAFYSIEDALAAHDKETEKG